MKVYIAGPMRGKEFFNFSEFDKAAAFLRELGVEPINPADLSRRHVIEQGRDPEIEKSYTGPGFGAADFIIQDLQALRNADGLVLLDGWTQSKGTAVELAFARLIEIPIYASTDEFEYFYRRAVHRQQAA